MLLLNTREDLSLEFLFSHAHMQGARHHSVHIEKQRSKPSITHMMSSNIEFSRFSPFAKLQNISFSFAFLLSVARDRLSCVPSSDVNRVSRLFSAFLFLSPSEWSYKIIFRGVSFASAKGTRCCENFFTFILASWIDERIYFLSCRCLSFVKVAVKNVLVDCSRKPKVNKTFRRSPGDDAFAWNQRLIHSSG